MGRLPSFFVYARLTGSTTLTEKEFVSRLLEQKLLREILEATLQINAQSESIAPEYHPRRHYLAKSSVYLSKTVVF